MYKSLNSKLVLIFIVFITAVMATVGIFLMNSVFDFYKNDFSNQLEEGFDEDMRSSLEEALLYDDFAAHQKEIIAAYTGSLGLDRHRNFYILDTKANILESSVSPENDALPLTPNLIRAMNKKDGVKQSYGADRLDFALYLENGGNDCIIYVVDDLSETRQLSFMLFSIIIRSLIIGLLIALVMAFFLAKAISRPIQTVTEGTRQISSGDYSHRLKISSKDEIGNLAKSFNSMAQIIENTLAEVSDEREKLKNVFNRLDAGVAAFEENGELIHINPAALSMLSLPDSAKPSFDELLCVLGISDVTKDGVKKSGNIHIEEKSLSEVKTRELVVNIDIGVFGGEGTANSGYIAVIQNITANALLEKNRREFIANVSHELRTPLTSVKGATETVLEDPDMPESIKKRFLGIVMNEADRMTRIVQDLLVLSRLDNRRMSWKPVRFELDDSLKNMCYALETQAAAHSHTLTYKCLVREGTRIFADKERIEQVVANIIGNSVKYTPDGGKIDVVLEKTPEADYLISVSDNGVGIPEDETEHLFERFYRVDKSRSTNAGGTGLGLSIAKEIIDAHNGKITIDSVFGKGTTVKILLPADTRVSSAEQ